MKKLFSHKAFLTTCLCALIAMPGMPLYAQSVTEDQAFYFGRIVIPDFGSVARVTIRNNGTHTTNANAFIIDAPTRGEYTLTGGPANTVYTITVPPLSLIGGGPGGNFELDNVTVRPNNLRTNGSGQDQFRLAGRLRSLGGGVVYNDGTYSDTFDIIISF